MNKARFICFHSWLWKNKPKLCHRGAHEKSRLMKHRSKECRYTYLWSLVTVFTENKVLIITTLGQFTSECNQSVCPTSTTSFAIEMFLLSNSRLCHHQTFRSFSAVETVAKSHITVMKFTYLISYSSKLSYALISVTRASFSSMFACHTAEQGDTTMVELISKPTLSPLSLKWLSQIRLHFQKPLFLQDCTAFVVGSHSNDTQLLAKHVHVYSIWLVSRSYNYVNYKTHLKAFWIRYRFTRTITSPHFP